MPRQLHTRHDPARRPATSRPARARPEPASPIAACVEVCNETLSYCLEQGGDHADRTHILGLIDCIDTCWYLSGLQARDSDLVGQALDICAEACRSCKESCESFGEDETLQRCAQACREAYEYCSK